MKPYLHKQNIFLIFYTLLCIVSADAQNSVYVGSANAIGIGATDAVGIFGDISVDGQISNAAGANIYFSGTTWTNNSTATLPASSGIGGRFHFIGSAAQNLDGGFSSGTQPSFPNIVLNNSNSLTLINTNTHFDNNLDFTTGYTFLANNNMIVGASGTITGNSSTKYIVTNGSGLLTKENLGASAAFTFPVGQAVTDYTPATVTNNGTAQTINVQVKNYAGSLPVEANIINGMDRSWQLYTSAGAGAVLSLTHNNTTNGVIYNTLYTVVAYITKWNGITWDTQAGVGEPLVAGTETVSRTLGTTAVAPGNNAWFSKTTDLLIALPVILSNFTASTHECSALLSWSTGIEQNTDRFEIEQSGDGINFKKISVVSAKNNSTGNSYNIPAGQLTATAYYRLRVIEKTGNYFFSKIIVVHTNCNNSKNNFIIFPNPVTTGDIHIRLISNYAGKANIVITNMAGQQLIKKEIVISNNITTISLEAQQLAAGIYYAQLVDDNGKVLNEAKEFIKK